MKLGIIKCSIAFGISIGLAGCGTTAYYPSGQKAVDARSNLRNFHFKGGGIAMSVGEMDNATPTKAAANGTVSAITALGAAAAGIR